MTNAEEVLYSLSKNDKTLPDGRVIPSLYRLYMACPDVTEYEFANKYFDGWSHWKQISEAWYMKNLVKEWREELEVKIRSDALKMIEAEAVSDSKYAYSANRYLADLGWKPDGKTSKGRGRPSKQQIADEATRIATEEHDVMNDLKRLGLN